MATPINGISLVATEDGQYWKGGEVRISDYARNQEWIYQSATQSFMHAKSLFAMNKASFAKFYPKLYKSATDMISQADIQYASGQTLIPRFPSDPHEECAPSSSSQTAATKCTTSDDAGWQCAIQ